MFGNDLSTLPLRSFLDARGYAASAWDLGVNLGPRAGVFDACLGRLRALRESHGRPVSLIGWSLGGLFARALALEAPDDVRLVISLGTPISGDPSPAQSRLYEHVTGDPMGLPPHLSGSARSLPVPSTSIYSRSDGIVPWQSSVAPTAPQAESIEVESSHLGLGSHRSRCSPSPTDLPAAPAVDPFERTGLRSWLYRDPARDGWFRAAFALAAVPGRPR